MSISRIIAGSAIIPFNFRRLGILSAKAVLMLTLAVAQAQQGHRSDEAKPRILSI